MSKKNSDENNKAYFLQRLLAYVLDMTIVVLVSTLISYPFISTKTVDKLNKQSSEILEKYQNQVLRPTLIKVWIIVINFPKKQDLLI